MMFPRLHSPDDSQALRFGATELSYAELAAATAAVSAGIGSAKRVAIWASPAIETVVGVLGALAAGVPVVPLNPKVGERELAHILSDSEPELMLAAPGAEVPGGVTRLDVSITGNGGALGAEPPQDAPAFIVYTSGTTGPPKGVVQPRSAVVSNLDALADAWQWTERDVVTHGLPLFHVHGLIVGTLGPLRRGGAVHHLGRFDSRAAAEDLAATGGMMFGVPTMYTRLADDVEQDAGLARQVGHARLLVSGSAALPASVHERITAATGQRIVERYGMTETFMNASVRADAERRPGTVGQPLSGVDIRLVEESGAVIEVRDDATVGEIEVRGPNVFTEYLNRPDATEEAFHDDWFRTGDVATMSADGYLRIVGRRATDLIKSGGYKIGAGEIENTLLEHAGVAEVAVTGEPDTDLGERVVAWIVPVGDERPSQEELADHVARLLTPYKRPRAVYFVESLPRNDMGKVMKKRLG
jgi:malonyl-CoA/methylmalonyl-CoA synthetase